MSVFFVDSNILIFASIDNYPEKEFAIKKLEEITRNNTLAVNTIIVSEVFHKISVILNRAEAIKCMESLLESDNIAYLPIQKETVKGAIILAANHHMRINDALIAQHVFDSKCEGILTDNVKDFKKIDGLKIINLR